MRRIVRRRVAPTVECAYLRRGDARGQVRTCGARIPYGPKKPCPACGEKQIRSSAPPPGPDDLVIYDDAVLVDEELGEVVAVHITGETQLASAIAQSLRHVREWERPGNEGRMSGISVQHNTFGFAGPSPLRSRWACTKCRFDRNYPDASALIYEFVATAERKFRELAPDVYEKSARAVAEVIPAAWRIEGTPWTSGIINHTAALPYHLDSGNIKGSWSAMLGARNDLAGGNLHLVDYDVYFGIPHGSISIFDGQSVLHGVTPFERAGHDPYRFTLVTYSKTNLKVCAPDPRDEVERAATRLTEMAPRNRRRGAAQ